MVLSQHWRSVCLALALLAAGIDAAAARSLTDAAGRTVTVPGAITRVFAAGPPASTLLYVVAPQTMTGWVRLPRAVEKPWLIPKVRELPELGRLTGRGDTLNLERLLANRPDVVIDYGSVSDTYRSLADRVQQQTGIPYVLIDGRFDAMPAALRLVGSLVGDESRGEELARAAERILAEADRIVATVPADRRPRVYLARGPAGLETGTRGSITTEVIERAGGFNVVEGVREHGNLVNVSAEQVIAWRPEAIVTLDAGFAANARQRPEWQAVPAVTADRIFLAPSLPFGFIDAPPSVNRLIGLTWLLHKLYPDRTGGGLQAQVRDFYRLFYQVDPDDAEIGRLLAGDTR